ncbi:MAG: S9 family peptidase [Bacilli bacterium]
MELHSDDIVNIALFGRPTMTPCRPLQAVAALSRMDKTSDLYLSELFGIDLESGESRELLDARELSRDHSPQWNPTGERLGFLRSTPKGDELWIYSSEGCKRVALDQTGIKQFVWHPDGHSLAFTIRTQEINDISYKVERLRYKLDGEGLTLGYTHVFLLNLDRNETVQVSSSLSDHGCPVFHPNGEQLLFVSDFADGDDFEKRPMLNTFSLKGGALTREKMAARAVSELMFTSGGELVGIGKQNFETSVEFDKLFKFDVDGGIQWLLPELDLPLGYHVISDVTRTGVNPILRSVSRNGIVFAGTRFGRQVIFFTDVQTGEVSEVPLNQNVICFDVLPPDDDGAFTISYVGDSFSAPADLYTAQWNPKGDLTVRQVTFINEEATKNWPVLFAEEHTYLSENGHSVQGWILSARIQEPSHATVVSLHGGPHMSYGVSFHFDWVYLCSLGYTVVICNPRGSYGYGQEYSSAILGEWGAGDVDDIFSFLEYVGVWGTEQYPVFLMGGSYGGFLVNWIIGHDHRFRAAISERSISNLYSKVGNSDLGFVMNLIEMNGADLWTDEEFIMARSPIRYAQDVQTPLLLLHGESDDRCPIEQSEQLFTALKRLNKEVEYIRFPKASHTLASRGKPSQRFARLNAIGEWFRKYSEDAKK